jgi:glycosyltransferase involved in cell wall biosynthesis
MISVCIPAYKHVALTQEAARSVLQQDVDVELIVLDDFNLLEATVENLRAIDSLKSYLHSEKRVKCVSNERQLSIQDNWNKAVSLCNGRYIKLIGADDRLLPGSIQKMQQLIEKNSSVAFFGHLANIIDINGSVIRRQRQYSEKLANKVITGSAALKGKLRQQVRFKEPACNFYLKSAWESTGGYDKNFRFTFDIHFNVKIMSCKPSMLCNDYLVDLRRHQTSDGAQLPASMALADLEGVVGIILDLLGDNVTLSDKSAARGWIEYRLIELVAQRFKRQPLATTKLIVEKIGLLIDNPFALYWTTKLLLNRGFFSDVQQN